MTITSFKTFAFTIEVDLSQSTSVASNIAVKEFIGTIFFPEHDYAGFRSYIGTLHDMNHVVPAVEDYIKNEVFHKFNHIFIDSISRNSIKITDISDNIFAIRSPDTTDIYAEFDKDARPTDKLVANIIVGVIHPRDSTNIRLNYVIHSMEPGLVFTPTHNVCRCNTGSNVIYQYHGLEEEKTSMGKTELTSKRFQELCKEKVLEYFVGHCDKTDNIHITMEDVYVVWYCKTLQNHKALLSTNVSDGMYYECTYNGDKNQLYMDCYKKWQNICFDDAK